METNRTVFGVDTAKRVFQLHGVDTETGEIVDLKLTRGKFPDRFANRAPRVRSRWKRAAARSTGHASFGVSATRSGC